MVLALIACSGGISSHPPGPGDVDTSFLASGTGADMNVVQSIALQPDGRILISGNFTTYDGIPRGALARLNSDGSLNTADSLNSSVFSPTTGLPLPQVWAIAVQADGKILIAGYFTAYNGTPRGSMARFDYDGSLDSSFVVAGADGFSSSVALQPDGKILIAGYSGITRLFPNGSLDTSFHATGTGADGEVHCLALQADGKILIGGYFSNYDGTPRGRIARLNTAGSLDTSFLATGTGANAEVYSIAVQSNGKIVVGGNFCFM
jgi:uncharacterized delta-60 repeat protein